MKISGEVDGSEIRFDPDEGGDGYEVLVAEVDGTAYGKGVMRVTAHPQNGITLTAQENGEPMRLTIGQNRIELAVGEETLLAVSSMWGEKNVTVDAQLKPDRLSIPCVTAPPTEEMDTGSIVFDRASGRLWIWDGGEWRWVALS